MSHELRTPLNAIMGFSEVMKDQHMGPVNNPRYLAYARDIHVSGRYLLGIINDILDLSKIEAGKMTLESAEEFELTPTVRDCLARLQPDVAVLPAGGARFDLGAEILMDAADMAEAAQHTRGAIVVNHLEALDHCPTTRTAVRQRALDGGWAHRLWVPEDGECREYQAVTAQAAM